MRPGVEKEPVRVLVDALSARTGGALSRLRALLPELDHQEGLRLTILATEPLSRELPGLCPRCTVLTRPEQATLSRLAWEQVALPSLARTFDVLYMPGNFGLLFPTVPVVVGVQSLWHWGRDGRRERKRCSPRLRIRLGIETFLARATVRRAAGIACLSETLRNALTEDLKVPGRLMVTAPGPPTLPGDGRAEHGYAIAVGTDLPHKDWDGLIAAFADDEDLPPLIVVGPVGGRRRRRLERAGRGQVTFLGPVTDRHRLGDLVRGSVCLVAHSRLESFGFVPLEGLLAGVPVAYSDIPAHREFCGDFGWSYACTEPEALRQAVKNAIAAGSANGSPPVLNGSWAETAAGLRDLFEWVCEQGRSATVG